MKRTLPISDLTENEANIRQLLLDTADHIAKSKNAKPILRFAGGWVRDKLLGSTSKDIDVAIDSITGEDFGLALKAFVSNPEAKTRYTALENGKNIVGNLALIAANPDKSKHLATATVRVFGLDVDFVNLRKETYAANSRTPQMEFGTAQEDAMRRDSTINALFYNIHTSEVEDFTGRGLTDMERKIIKTPLPALQTFRDDPLRVLRHIRFASRLGFHIDYEDERAIRDPSIQDEFKLRVTRDVKGSEIGKKTKGQAGKRETELKISRERVGIEVEKMLKGPDPHTALKLIDQFGLYNTIFTNADDDMFGHADATHWSKAYGQLSSVLTSQTPPDDDSDHLAIIKSLLLRDSAEEYRAWLLCALVPWARAPGVKPEQAGGKSPPSPATLATREGIKADNKIVKLVEDAVRDLQDIINHKDEGADATQSTDHTSPNVPRKRTYDVANLESRVKQGKAIRVWGPNWRSSVMYALLVQVTESEEKERPTAVKEFATWLQKLEAQELLEVDFLKPIVNGNQLSKALNEKPGPWMKKALEIIIEWQLRNPKTDDPGEAIAEVRRRKDEIGLG